VLEVKDLGVSYGRHTVLNGVSFRVEAGQWLMIAGPNGAGKSTILNAITQGVDYTGSVLFEGEDVKTMKASRRARRISVLAQLLDEPTNHLDLVYQKQVFTLIGQWLEQPGRAVVSVVHDLSLAKAFGTHGLLMNRGRAVSRGEIGAVLSPKNLDPVYGMDVGGWMRAMLAQWNKEDGHVEFS